jgi:ERCC4-type nuclease
MKITVDSREQEPFSFTGPRYEGTTCEVGTLQSGDYTLAGLGDRVAVERKSLQDLTMCLGRERPRFERELMRAAAFDAFCVVVEASWGDLATRHYRSQLDPHSACQSVAAFSARYRIPFMFCGSREGAQYFCWSFLRQFLETARKRYASILQAHGVVAV